MVTEYEQIYQSRTPDGAPDPQELPKEEFLQSELGHLTENTARKKYHDYEKRPVGPGLTKNLEIQEYPDGEDCSLLLPCVICNRTFFPRALERHQKVCEKVQAQKRVVQPFETTKKRQEGFDIPLLGIDPPGEKVEKKKKSRWRQRRQEFLRQIRAAKIDKNDGSDEEGGRFIPSDYLQCPHCERYFGPKAFDRHESWCAEKKQYLPRQPTEDDVEAIKRLKTRTKYVPPKPGQSDWKAPKKRDVVSSIPPQAPTSNPSMNRGLRSPSPSIRIPSPFRNISRTTGVSPQPGALRKGASASLPPERFYSGSLGRSSGRKFSAALNSVTGCQPGYGLSSGYGSPSMYGNPAGFTPPGFSRSNSLRAPKRQSGRMARHRDLALDMLASVTQGGKPQREAPDGDEAEDIIPYGETYSIKDKLSYDPYSAAQLQFEDLLYPSDNFYAKSIASKSTKDFNTKNYKDVDFKSSGYDDLDIDLKNCYRDIDLMKIGYNRPEDFLSSPDDMLTGSKSVPNRPENLTGGSKSLCNLGFDAFDYRSLNTDSPLEDSSELESPQSVDQSPTDVISLSTTEETRSRSGSPARERSEPLGISRNNDFYKNSDLIDAGSVSPIFDLEKLYFKDKDTLRSNRFGYNDSRLDKKENTRYKNTKYGYRETLNEPVNAGVYQHNSESTNKYQFYPEDTGNYSHSDDSCKKNEYLGQSGSNSARKNEKKSSFREWWKSSPKLTSAKDTDLPNARLNRSSQRKTDVINHEENTSTRQPRSASLVRLSPSLIPKLQHSRANPDPGSFSGLLENGTGAQFQSSISGPRHVSGSPFEASRSSTYQNPSFHNGLSDFSREPRSRVQKDSHLLQVSIPQAGSTLNTQSYQNGSHSRSTLGQRSRNLNSNSHLNRVPRDKRVSPVAQRPSYCSQCGCQFSFSTARFCSNCGSKRICS